MEVCHTLRLGASEVAKILIRALGLPDDAIVTDNDEISPPMLIVRWSTTEEFPHGPHP